MSGSRSGNTRASTIAITSDTSEGALIPDNSRPCICEFLPSADQALTELEETTRKTVQIVTGPHPNVVATNRRAGPGSVSHLRRIKSSENQEADYLIVFQCRIALRDGHAPPRLLCDNPAVRNQVIYFSSGYRTNWRRTGPLVSQNKSNVGRVPLRGVKPEARMP